MSMLADLLREVLRMGDEKGVRYVRSRHVPGGTFAQLAYLTHDHAFTVGREGNSAGERIYDAGILPWWRDEGGLSQREVDRLYQLRSDVVDWLEEQGLASRSHPRSTPLHVWPRSGAAPAEEPEPTPAQQPPARERVARSADDVWMQIQAICREAIATGRTIVTIDRGIPNRILDVRPNEIVRASDDARTQDGRGAPVRRVMIEHLWQELASGGHAGRISGVLFFAYALVAEIPGVAVDNDRRGLHIADWDLAMTPYGDGSGVGTTPQHDEGQDDEASGWPVAEIQPTVAAYFVMLRAELASQEYVKAHFNRQVQTATGRSRGAVEFKFANVSAVLRDIGLPYVLGYQPRGNYQGALRAEVERYLDSDAEIARLLEEAPAPDLPSTVELKKVDPPVMAPWSTTGRGRTTVGVDYLARQERNRDVGLKGELLVVEHERTWLSSHGRPDLAELVAHVPGTLGDGAGYDVSSFLLNGLPHHIEVKTTRGSHTAPFFLSESERRYALDPPEAYSIYRIFDLGANPQFYKLTGNMAEILDLTPVSYQARVKAPGAHSPAQG
jgi:hypothetical protein